jgi:nucleoside-diphosphate-sugar epimerase
MNHSPIKNARKTLIGHTGLVGSNLIRQCRFDACYNSSNIHEIAGTHHKLLICSGVSGTKWIANREPEKDRAAIASLLEQLKKCTADKVILISTVDVYATPTGVDEDTPIDTSLLHSYGTHRYQFEKDILDLFPHVLIARLPGIYGWNLQKNALYDLMHRHELEKIHPASVYQFYWLEHLWRDLEQASNAGLNVLNFATEPLAIQEVANAVFGIHLDGTPPVMPAAYDFRTKHAKVMGGTNGYLYDKATALDEIRTFVAQQRLCRPFSI